MKASEGKRFNAEDAELGAHRAQREPEKTKDARFDPIGAGRSGRYMSKVKVESKNANREIGVPRGARLTLWRAGAQRAAPLPRLRERGGAGQNIFSGRRRVPTEPRLEMRKTQRY